MAGNDTGKDGTEVVKDTKVTKDPTQLLADTRKAGQDAVDAVLDLIPEVEHKLPPVYPRIDVASALTISRHHTEKALKNVHTQISDLIRTHVAGPEQAGVFFNTILPITCSFRHQMDEMAINLLFPGSQLVPNVWSAHREVLEGLSLVAPPSCSASWPASLVEWVAPIPGTSGQLGSAKTPTKPCNPGAGKLAPGSGKKTQPIQQAAGMFWGDKKKREKEDADARAQEEKCRKKPSGPILSLDENEHSITELIKRAAPSQSAQPSGKTPSSAPKDWVRPRKDPIAVPDPSNNEPLSDQANEPKAKAHKRNPTPELVVVDDDDSTPLPGRQKTPKKSLPVEEEATEANSYSTSRARPELCSTIWSYLPQWTTRTNSFRISRGLPTPMIIPNTSHRYGIFPGVIPPKEICGQLVSTSRSCKTCKDREMVEQGEAVLRDRGMLGIPQESRKSGPIKALVRDPRPPEC